MSNLPDLPNGQVYFADLEKIVAIENKHGIPSNMAYFTQDGVNIFIIPLEYLREAIEKGMYTPIQPETEEEHEEESNEPIQFHTSNGHRALAVLSEWADDATTLIQAWINVKGQPRWSRHMLKLGGVPEEAADFVDGRLRELLD